MISPGLLPTFPVYPRLWIQIRIVETVAKHSPRPQKLNGNMWGMALLDNDRLSHWFAGALFTWLMIFLIWGLLLFHLWLKIPTARIAAYTGICCAMQLAITPWLFSARSTRQNPKGLVTRRAGALIVLFLGITLLLLSYIPIFVLRDRESRQFGVMSLVTILLLALAGLIKFGVFPRRGKDSPPITRPKE